jgi:hypothetical protein
MIDQKTASRIVNQFATANLDFPPDADGIKALAKMLARKSHSAEHAEAVVEKWIESWPKWPRPSDIVQMCEIVKDPALPPPAPVARLDCRFCAGTGWEDREGVLNRGIFAGESFTFAVRCRCGGLPPVIDPTATYEPLVGAGKILAVARGAEAGRK